MAEEERSPVIAALVQGIRALVFSGNLEAGASAERHLAQLGLEHDDDTLKRVLSQLSSFDLVSMIEGGMGVPSLTVALLEPSQLVQAARVRLLLVSEEIQWQHVSQLQGEITGFLFALLHFDRRDTLEQEKKHRLIRALFADDVTHVLCMLACAGIGANRGRSRDLYFDNEMMESFANAVRFLDQNLWRTMAREVLDTPYFGSVALSGRHQDSVNRGYLRSIANQLNVLRHTLTAEMIGVPPAFVTAVFRPLVRSRFMHAAASGGLEPGRTVTRSSALVVVSRGNLFFEAWSCAVRQNLIAFDRPAGIEESCVELSLAFAVRYRSPFYAGYLREAAGVVEGVLNLALHSVARGNIHDAATCLAMYPLQEMFRIGWKRILELVQAAVDAEDPFEVSADFGATEPTVHELQRCAALMFASERTDVWPGEELYAELIQKYRRIAARTQFTVWMAREFFDVRVSHPSFQREGGTMDRLNTLCVSLIADEQPHGPLSIENIKRIIAAIQDGSARETFVGRGRRFRASVEPRFQEAWDVCVELFAQELERWEGFARYISWRAMLDECYRHFWFDESPDHVDEELRQATRDELDKYGRDSLIEILAGSGGNITPDRALRAAVMERFLGESMAPEQTDEIVALVSNIPPEEWRGKIRWDRVPWDILLEAVKPGELDDIVQAQILHDIFNCYRQYAESAESWQSMPLTVAFLMCEAIEPENRLFLIERVRADGAEIALFVFGNPGYGKYFCLVPPEHWYDVWLERGDSVLNPLLVFGDRAYFGWKTSQERLDYLFRIVAVVASRWRTAVESGPMDGDEDEECFHSYSDVDEDADEDENDEEDESPRVGHHVGPPFWAPGLRTALYEVITSTEVESLADRLQQYLDA